MPGRYIREGILTSDKVDALSESAEVFYRRLLNVVDDHGRYYASVLQLFCNCYPLKEQLLNEADQLKYFHKISANLKECVDAKLVFLYCEKKYLQLVNFNQGKRSKSKFPEPRLTNVKQLQNECKTDVKQVLNRNDNDNDNDNEVWKLRNQKKIPERSLSKIGQKKFTESSRKRQRN